MTENKSVDDLKKEIESLKAQVQSLQSKSVKSKSSRDSDKDDIGRIATDSGNRFLDETAKLARSYSATVAEMVAASADAISVFSDELSRRNKEEDEDDSVKNFTRLPTDLWSGYLKAMKESVDIPGRMVKKFNDTYQGAGKN
jgi:hypothetical protein